MTSDVGFIKSLAPNKMRYPPGEGSKWDIVMIVSPCLVSPCPRWSKPWRPVIQGNDHSGRHSLDGWGLPLWSFVEHESIYW